MKGMSKGPKKKLVPKAKETKIAETDTPHNEETEKEKTICSRLTPKKFVYLPKMKSVWVMKKKPVPDIKSTRPASSTQKSDVKDEEVARDLRSQTTSEEFKSKAGINNRISKFSVSPKRKSTKLMKAKVEAWKSLQDAAMGFKPLSVLEPPDKHPAQELLFTHKNLGHNQLEAYNQNFIKQRNALEYWDEVQDDRLKLEQLLTDKSGRTRGKTINRKDLHLPKSEPDGLEVNLWTVERPETPDVFPDWTFFQIPKVRSNGLSTYISKKDRGYNISKDFVGRPNTIVTCKADDVKQGTSTDNETDSKKNNQSNRNCVACGDGKININSSFQPLIDELFIVGKDYKSTQDCLKEQADHKQNLTKIVFNTSEDNAEDVVSLKSYRRGTPSIIQLNEWTREKYNSTASIKFGPHVLYFSRLPKHKEFIVECGSASDVGKTSMSHVHLANLGTTAVHFSFSKVTPNDNLSTHRYIHDHFVFDNWGGTILPSETFEIPILYKSIEAGYFSEDWKLLTQPPMENGAPVILRLWGLSKEYDPHFYARERIEEALKKNIPWNIAGLQVRKIIDYLPMTETQYKDIRFRLVTEGPDLFIHHNPALKYNTASVYRLGKLLALLRQRESKFLRQTVAANQSTISENNDSFRNRLTVVSTEVSPTPTDSCVTVNEMEDIIEEKSVNQEESNASRFEIMRERLNSKAMDSLLAACIKRSTSPAVYIMGLIDPDAPQVAESQPEVQGSTTMSPVIKYSHEEVSRIDSRVDSLSKAEVFENSLLTVPLSTTPANSVKNKQVKKLSHIINLADPNYSVDEIRKMILKEKGALEVQEAFFEIMVQEYEKLCYRPPIATEDWRQTVFFNMFAETIDKFDDYAARLKAVHREAEDHKRRKMSRLSEYNNDIDLENKSNYMYEEKQSTKSQEMVETTELEELRDYYRGRSTAESISEEETTMKFETATEDSHSPRLQEAMYQLLTDLMDNVEPLLATKEKSSLRFDYSEGAFTKNILVERCFDGSCLDPTAEAAGQKGKRLISQTVSYQRKPRSKYNVLSGSSFNHTILDNRGGSPIEFYRHDYWR